MNRPLFLFLFFIFSVVYVAPAQNREGVKTSTDILMFATPVAGFISTLAVKDYQGTKQLILAGTTSLATSYLLKYTIKKQRPDESDNHSFPSNHTAMAFQGASFIHLRYGWKYSLPAYLVSSYVAWGRVYSKSHDCLDVLSGAVIGIGSTCLFTQPFTKKYHLTLSPAAYENTRWGFYASMTF